MITNSMAILLTMTLPRLFIFFKVAAPSCIRFWHSLQSKIRFQVQLIRLQPGSRLDAFESTPLVLMPHSGVLNEPGSDEQDSILTPESAHLTDRAYATFHEAMSFQHAAIQCARRLTTGSIELGVASSGIQNRFRIIYRNFQNDKIGFASVTTLILIFFSAFVGLQILAILMVQIVSGSDALSISPKCGYWRPDPNLNRSLLVDTDAETRAASWVDTCYDDRGANNSQIELSATKSTMGSIVRSQTICAVLVMYQPFNWTLELSARRSWESMFCHHTSSDAGLLVRR